MKEFIQVMKALSDRNRVRIVKMLGQGIHQKIFIWDQGGDLRFFAYNGDPAVFDPVECATDDDCAILADCAEGGPSAPCTCVIGT